MTLIDFIQTLNSRLNIYNSYNVTLIRYLLMSINNVNMTSILLILLFCVVNLKQNTCKTFKRDCDRF